MSKFPTTWEPTPYTFVQPPKKSGGRLIVCIFVGAVVGLFLSVALGENVWLPAAGVTAFALYALSEG